MSAKQPRLAGGIVVSDTCTINILDGTGTSRNITIPTGTYWLDPVCNGIVASDTVDALGVLAELIDTADTGGTFTCTYLSGADTASETVGWGSQITRSGGTWLFRPTNAGTNTSGKRFLRFLGFNALADATAAISMTGVIPPALWDTTRGENGSPEEEPEGFGVMLRTAGSVAYAYNIGDPLMERIVSFPGLKADAVKRRNNVSLAIDQVTNFESILWPWLATGSPVRYWADRNATQNTYLAAAMLATDTTLTLPTNALFSGKSEICVDGEWMFVHAGSGTTTVTVYRDNPVAHGKYAPVSTDFVGAYVLNQTGGNVNLRGFKPKRRSEADDRWDMALSLVRTVGV